MDWAEPGRKRGHHFTTWTPYLVSAAARSAMTYKRQRRNAPGSEDRPIITEIGEYTRTRRNYGRYKKRDVRYLLKNEKINHDIYYQRFTGVKAFMTNGYFGIWNAYDTTANTGGAYLPIRLFDLTNLPQAGTSADVCFDMRISNAATPSISVTSYNGTGNDGTSLSKGWQQEDVGVANTVWRVGRLKYVNARFLLYGTTSLPVRYEIGMLWIRENEYNPGYWVDTSSSSTTSSQAISLWQWFMAGYAYNPVQLQNGVEHKRHIRYQRLKSVLLESTQTNEGSSSVPHCKQVDVFIKKDHLCRFDWVGTTKIATGVAGGAGDFQQGAAFERNVSSQLKNNVDYRHRCFLVVRALVKPRSTTGAPSTVTVATDPSFDLVLREKWEVPVQ